MKTAAAQGRTSIAVRELQRILQQGACDLIDVRTPPEFATAHVPGARLVPLDILSPTSYLQQRADRSAPLYIICQSGTRAAKALDRLGRAGFNNGVLVEGGTQAWIDAGLPFEQGKATLLPLMRQVQIVVGFFAALGAALALMVDPLFAVLPLLVGAGLLFAGLTGWCGLALLLARMPWNREASCRSQGCCR